jgi:hypothetical protein
MPLGASTEAFPYYSTMYSHTPSIPQVTIPGEAHGVLGKHCSADVDDRLLLTLLPDETTSLPLLTPLLLTIVLTHFSAKFQLMWQGLGFMLSAQKPRLLGSWQDIRIA